MDLNDSLLDQLLLRLEKIQNEKLENDEKVANWLEQITSNEFRLIDSLVLIFVKNKDDSKILTNILKILKYVYLIKCFRILLQFKEKNVKEQLAENAHIPQVICEYIANREQKDMVTIVYGVLYEIYSFQKSNKVFTFT